MQLLQVDILRQVVRLPMQLLVGAARLLLETEYGVRQAPHEPQASTFLWSEGGSPVGQGINHHLGQPNTVYN
ncbi:hypothetical protein GCM10022295_91330 [Streptomyces osmaniensis]|uniref:Transposase n=1 Tax=Streptomyces osmaniensis TaxID=593134 RepID=A0ABP6Z3D2_9ACTN